MPSCYVISGPNGSGKTTVALSLLPSLGVTEFVNADAIASGLSPLNPEGMALRAGRLMLERLHGVMSAGMDFAFETTLAARSYVSFLQDCKRRGYSVNLIYFWLRSPELAVERVKRRVASGGHSIPEETIRRRYERGRRNLIDLYLPLSESWIIFDNSGPTLLPVSQRGSDGQPLIYDTGSWEQITQRTR